MILFIIRDQMLLIFKKKTLKREKTRREQIGREQMRNRTNANIPICYGTNGFILTSLFCIIRFRINLLQFYMLKIK